MYPRNAASPEPIAIGPVVQISDGAVQTSGCTVRIFPAGGAEGDGAGATAYSTDGVVLYTPTQAETNYTSFILIAKKAGCIPACTTVVTSASATAGYAGTDQSKIANPTATVALTNTTINDAQKVDLNTVKTRAVQDYGSGHTYYIGGDNAANGAAGGIAIVGSNMGTVTLANGAHGGAAATLVLSDYSAFKATGFSTHSAADVAALILATPAQKLVTDANGYVTYSNAAPPSAADIVNEWESQSQADPTGFHVNIMEVRGRTAGDVGEGNTAHWLQAADTGATYVARTGTDSDTLETLSDQLDTITTAVGSLYWANVRHTIDDTDGSDLWTIVPMKDGVAQTSATGVTLTVTKRSDGTALINAQAATQIGATSVWKYTASTSERINDGTDSYVAVVTFTCDAAIRTAPPVLVARDG